MVEHLWDGKIEFDWIELEDIVVETSLRFSTKMLDTVSYSTNIDTQKLINKSSMSRFVEISRSMSEDLIMGAFYEDEDEKSILDNPYKLNIWIVLGSLTECALQVYLAFYLDDYRNSNWQQWEDINISEIQNPIIDVIKELMDKEIVTREQGRTLIEAIKDKIKEHTMEHPVERIMLDEIIHYYSKMNLLDDIAEIDILKKIQSNRNGIHSFEGREIGKWSELKYCIRYWCYLLDWILYRLPDIPDYS